MISSRSAVALTSLCNAIQVMNDRLTHLLLAENRLAGIPQIVSALSVSFINLLHILVKIFNFVLFYRHIVRI